MDSGGIWNCACRPSLGRECPLTTVWWMPICNPVRCLRRIHGPCPTPLRKTGSRNCLTGHSVGLAPENPHHFAPLAHLGTMNLLNSGWTELHGHLAPGRKSLADALIGECGVERDISLSRSGRQGPDRTSPTTRMRSSPKPLFLGGGYLFAKNNAILCERPAPSACASEVR